MCSVSHNAFCSSECLWYEGNPYGSCGDNVRWKFENGTLTISGTGSMDNSRTRLDSINNWPWHEYCGNDFVYYYAHVTKIIVEDGVTEIAHHAFRDFPRLESVTIADSVTNIKNNAFLNCKKLSSINLGNGLKTLDYHAFIGCSALTEITLPATMETICENAFRSCSNLQTVTFKTPVSQHNLSIHNNFNDSGAVVRYEGKCSLFYGNNRVLQGTQMRFLSAKTFVLKPYEIVGEGLCGSNMAWEIDKKDYTLAIKFYDLSVFGVQESNIEKKMYDYKNATEVPWYHYRNDLKGVTIEEGVTRIGNYAFSGCTALTDIVIPSTINEIGVSAFKDCTALKNVVLPSSLNKIGNSVFQNCTGLTDIVIPSTVNEIGEATFQNCAALKNIVFPSSLNKIGRFAFQNCAALQTVTFIVPPSISGKIEFGAKSFGNTTAVIRYKGEGVLKNEYEYEGYCLTAGSTLSNLGGISHNRFVWFPNSSINFSVKREGDIFVKATSGTEFSIDFKIVHKFGLIRDVKWNLNHKILFSSPFSGDHKVEITESNDNSAKLTLFVEALSKPIYFAVQVTASCGDISRYALVMVMFEPPENASTQSASAADASEIKIQRENAILNGKTGDTLSASYRANSSDVIWTLMPDAETLEHAKSFDIISSGNTAKVEAVFDRKGEYNAFVFAKNSSGDIVDADALNFTVTDNGTFTLAPDGFYFNATAGEPKEASIKIKSNTSSNFDDVKWEIYWDKKPTSENITSTGSILNITAAWDTPGEYHALVTADSKECFDYTILTFSVAKTNIFELLLDKLFFGGMTDEEFEDASILISGNVDPSVIEWTLNFDGRVISEEELNFLCNDDGASANPIFSTEGEHQIQIIASKGDCTRSVTFTFIVEAGSETNPSKPTSNVLGSSGGGCNTGFVWGMLAVLMAFRKKN